MLSLWCHSKGSLQRETNTLRCVGPPGKIHTRTHTHRGKPIYMPFSLDRLAEMPRAAEVSSKWQNFCFSGWWIRMMMMMTQMDALRYLSDYNSQWPTAQAAADHLAVDCGVTPQSGWLSLRSCSLSFKMRCCLLNNKTLKKYSLTNRYRRWSTVNCK